MQKLPGKIGTLSCETSEKRDLNLALLDLLAQFGRAIAFFELGKDLMLSAHQDALDNPDLQYLLAIFSNSSSIDSK